MIVRVGITGAAGRMGRMLAQAIADSDTPARLTAAIERPESTLLGADIGELLGGEASGVLISSDLSAVADQIDVLIDFTVPESSLAQAVICAERGLPMVAARPASPMSKRRHSLPRLPACLSVRRQILRRA